MPASIVTVFVLAFVIRIYVKVEFGAWLLDQFDPVRHRPLVELIQLFVVAAWVLLWINKAADSRVEASKPQVRP